MSLDDSIQPVPNARVTIMDAEVWEALDRLGVGDDILDEVLWQLKEVPPEYRVRYLEIWFDDRL